MCRPRWLPGRGRCAKASRSENADEAEAKKEGRVVDQEERDELAEKVTQYIETRQDDVAQEDRWRTTMKKEISGKFAKLHDHVDGRIDALEGKLDALMTKLEVEPPPAAPEMRTRHASSARRSRQSRASVAARSKDEAEITIMRRSARMEGDGGAESDDDRKSKIVSGEACLLYTSPSPRDS